ncbi:hypothetical protein QUA99_25300 [Microcoleus sp. F10-B2]
MSINRPANLNSITAIIDPRKTAFLDNINAQANLFSEALMKRHYIRVQIKFSLACSITQRFVAYSLTVDEGVMASINYYPHTLHGQKSAHYIYEIFAELSLDDQIEAFLNSIDCYLKDYGPHYHRLKAAINDHAQLEENRLCAIGVGLAQISTDHFSVELAWEGFGNDLEFGRQHEAINIFATAEDIYEVARKLLARTNQRDAAREARRTRGLRPDRPLAAMLRDMNATCEELHQAAKAHGFVGRRAWQELTPSPMVFNGQTLSVKFRNGDVISKFKLAENVTWNDGNLKIVGVDLPDSLISSSKGRKLREVVDHPWLDGLVITHANAITKRDHTKMINFNTKEL